MTVIEMDHLNTEPSTIGTTALTCRWADTSGTSNDPYMTIVYRPGGMVYAGPTASCYQGTGSQE